jgi:hypothetical protein
MKGTEEGEGNHPFYVENGARPVCFLGDCSTNRRYTAKKVAVKRVFGLLKTV